jgi:RecA-family ATPase
MPIDIISALTQRPENLDFVLPGLVAGTVGAIVSPGGSGKSALALQICAQMAGGPDLLGIGITAQAAAAYMPGEDPELAVRHRLFALGEKCDQSHREALSRRLYIEPLESMTVNLMSTEWFDYFMQIANGRRLVVLDTLRIVHQLDENDSGAMTQLIGQMKIIAAKTKCAIVFLHHTSKSSAMNDQGAEQQASRGSSVLVDNIRWQGYLRTMSPADAKEYGVEDGQRRYFVEFGVSKQNYGSPFTPVWLRKVSCSDSDIAGGYTLQRAVLEKARRASETTREARREFAN